MHTNVSIYISIWHYKIYSKKPHPSRDPSNISPWWINKKINVLRPLSSASETKKQAVAQRNYTEMYRGHDRLYNEYSGLKDVCRENRQESKLSALLTHVRWRPKAVLWRLNCHRCLKWVWTKIHDTGDRLRDVYIQFRARLWVYVCISHPTALPLTSPLPTRRGLWGAGEDSLVREGRRTRDPSREFPLTVMWSHPPWKTDREEENSLGIDPFFANKQTITLRVMLSGHTDRALINGT